MPPFSISLACKAAPVLLPVAATFFKYIIGDDKGLRTKLAETGIDLLKDKTQNSLVNLLHKDPDLTHLLLDEHLMRFTGRVLTLLVEHYACHKGLPDDKRDLAKLAKNLPEAWLEFTRSGSPGFQVLSENDFLNRLAEQIIKTPEAVLQDVPFALVLKWAAAKSKLTTLHRNQELLAKVADHLKNHLGQTLLSQIVTETPENLTAWRKITLHHLTTGQQQLKELQSMLGDIRGSAGVDLDNYARNIERHCERIPFSDRVENQGVERLKLSALFVEPHVRAYPELDPSRIAADRDLTEAVRKGNLKELPASKQERARELMELERNSPARLAYQACIDPQNTGHIILAHAGVGKTSLVRRIALSWSQKRLHPDTTEPHFPLPLLIELKTYAAAYHEDHTLTLLDFLHGCESSIDRLDRAWCRYYLRIGAAVLILDGLDEVTHRETRQSIANDASRLRRLGARVIVTSRREGFIADHWRDQTPEWSGWLLEDFTQDQRTEFITKMFFRLYMSEGERKTKSAELRRRLRMQTSISQLSSNPLLLTLICILFRAGRMGDSRIAIYREASELLLDRWEADHFGPQGIPLPLGIYANADIRREIVRHLALQIITPEEKTQECFSENLFGEELFKDSICTVFDPDGRDRAKAKAAADVLINHLTERHSVICYAGAHQETGERLYAFIHRTFLEYFAALAWVEELDADNAKDTSVCQQLLTGCQEGNLPRWQDSRFANILPFYFGLLPEKYQHARILLLWQLADLKPLSDPANILFQKKFTEVVQRHCSGLLFAATCLAEIANRELKHRDFTDKLWHQLTDYSLWSTISEQERNTAVRLIALLWGQSEKGRRWLEYSLYGSLMLYSVTPECIRQLGDLYGTDLKLRKDLLRVINDAGRDIFACVQAIETFGNIWGKDPELRALLQSLLQNKETATHVRRQAIKTFAEVWGQDTDLRTYLLRLLPDKDEEIHVREQAIVTFAQVWEHDPDLRTHLIQLLFDKEDKPEVCQKAIAVFGQVWRQDAELRASLLRLMSDKEADKHIRSQAIETFGQVWGQDAALRAHLLQILGDKNQGSYLSLQARRWLQQR